MQQQTGYQTGVGYGLPPIGSAEILAAEDESEFGIPVDFVDPTQYHGKTPQPDLIVGVAQNL